MTRARNIADIGDDVASGGSLVTTSSPSLGRRNLIINGAMQVAQRGTSAVNASSSGAYGADRFLSVKSSAASGAYTIQQVADAPDYFQYSDKAVVTTADALGGTSIAYQFMQRLEGQDIVNTGFGTSSAKTLTLSFYVKSSLTGTFSLGVFNNDFTRQLILEYTISSANTWELITLEIPPETSGTWSTDNTVGLQIRWSLGATANITTSTTGSWINNSALALASSNQVNLISTNGATWQITGVQLEVGSVASSYEHRSFGEELALCQRYYWRLGWPSAHNAQPNIGLGFYLNSARVDMAIDLPVSMRTTPAIVANSGTGYWNAYVNGDDLFNSWSGVNAPTNNTFIIYSTDGLSGSAGNAVLVGKKDNAASLAADAEL